MKPTDKTTKIREQLLTAKHKKLVVKFGRPYEQRNFTGYVLDVGSGFFLLASLGEGLEFEQFTCLKIADIRHLQCPAANARFYTKVRKLRGDKLPAKPKADLTDQVSVLDSLHRSLVTIYREQVNPNACHIGYVLSRSKTVVQLFEIDPDAAWETEPSYYRINQITRIDLPGPYEQALLAVGGEPRLQSA